MKKDGSIYLAKIVFESGLEQWELIHWGKPIAMSDVTQKETWCNQMGFGLKIKNVIFYTLLENLEKNNVSYII